MSASPNRYGVMNGYIDTYDSPVPIADDDGALDPELAHQLDRVLGHVVEVEWTIRDVGRAPMPHLFHRDHPKLAREERDPFGRDRTLENHGNGF